ncbi:hypothetical protein KBY72_14005 [Cyanobium sp. BA5m-21]|uniref:hypothetical protein n=1 Tax=unclassified Cyanobium TaxID=2627006 RepID=UPI0020CD2F41|nr:MULTISPECIES: hypothetical protein [unclassified Cyanobium]MCP9903099.1 hypothetical protein [Cyanobium sp. BA5m-10]MCP9908273.1 hypothetical protein [Cyanobium sp. BA5m-21]
MKSTLFIALSLASLTAPVQAASCSDLSAKRASYVQQAEDAYTRQSYAVSKKLMELAEAKSAELKVKGCR